MEFVLVVMRGCWMGWGVRGVLSIYLDYDTRMKSRLGLWV